MGKEWLRGVKDFFSRSTDNGETWTEYEVASYKPGARDGMPVSVVLQEMGNYRMGR